MAISLLVCPQCGTRMARGTGNSWPRCPQCGVEAVARRLPNSAPAGRPAAPPPHPPEKQAATPQPTPDEPAPAGPSRTFVILGLAGAGFLLLAAAAIVVVLAFWGNSTRPDQHAGATATETARDSNEEPPVRKAAVTPVEHDTRRSKPEPSDPHEAPPPPTTLSAEVLKEVDEAIEQGVVYLKKHAPDGPMGNRRMSGLHPLVALTLLECGVPANDPVLARLTQLIRADADKLSETYSLSLAILFFDRLGDEGDKKLMRLLAARLLAGQQRDGGWTYDCLALSAADAQLFLTYLDSHPLSAATPRSSPADSGRADKPSARDSLPATVKDRAVVVYDPKVQVPVQGIADNSNTQFAILGIWAARRHGVPVERSLALIAARFRQSQNPNGSWGYHSHTKVYRDSMTCAGLLGLAVARASEGGRESAEKDPAITRGLEFLSAKVQKPSARQPRNPNRPRQARLKSLVGAEAFGDLYWLWSVERVAVIYNLATLGDKDWYAWGAGLLLDAQADDGSWDARHGPVIDTCFALLFLKRVNVAKDLTHQLQMIGPVRDPGQTPHDK
jgi:hypothetical protein